MTAKIKKRITKPAITQPVTPYLFIFLYMPYIIYLTPPDKEKSPGHIAQNSFATFENLINFD